LQPSLIVRRMVSRGVQPCCCIWGSFCCRSLIFFFFFFYIVLAPWCFVVYTCTARFMFLTCRCAVVVVFPLASVIFLPFLKSIHFLYALVLLDGLPRTFFQFPWCYSLLPPSPHICFQSITDQHRSFESFGWFKVRQQGCLRWKSGSFPLQVDFVLQP
jgi:hypothetical protein